MAYSDASSLIDKVALQLNDANKSRWTQSELVTYLNDGIKAVCLRRPDAYTVTEAFSCVPGTQQQTPANCITLLNVLRNTTGQAIRGPHDTLLLDNYRPDWRESTGEASVDIYMYDERSPGYFYIYPGVSAGHSIDIVYTSIPSDLSENDVSIGGTVPIENVYDNPIMDWMIYRAFNKDAEYTANSQRAMLSLNAFKTALGEKSQADNATFTSNHEDTKKMK